MPIFVHLAPEPLARRIRRNGIAPRRLNGWIDGRDRFVWAFPVLPSFTLTHQWLRELKRRGAHTLVSVTFRLPDSEPVYAHRYGQSPISMTAAEAVAHVRQQADPRGGEVVVPRRILPREIVRIVEVPQHMGWRFFPEAKAADRRPCDCPMCASRGEPKARRYRARIPVLAARWDAKRRPD